MESESISRRSLLKGSGTALAGVTALQIAGPSSLFGQAGGEVIPWLDQPPPAPLPPSAVGNQLVWEKLDSWLTPAHNFFYVTHYGIPQIVDTSTWRLQITGLIARPRNLTMANLKARRRREVEFTIECSGNHGFPFVTGLVGNARWGGTPLAPVLREMGLLDQAIEVVFWGVDSGNVTIRDNGGILTGGRTGTVQADGEGGLDLTITEHFARSMSISEALHPDNLLCYEMNDEALPPEHGFPLRLIAPGWYGVANVKWLTRIEVLDHRFAGRFMTRDYVTIRERQQQGQTVWTFTTVRQDLLKSAPARVTRRNGRYAIMGAAWGAPIAAVQVQVDNGPWMATELERPPSIALADVGEPSASDMERAGQRRKGRRGYAWTFWHFDWGTPAAGEHTIRSRAFDSDGNMQPAPDDPFLATKTTYWESNGQITRRILIR